MNTSARTTLTSLLLLLCSASPALAQSSGLFGSRSLGGGVRSGQGGNPAMTGTPGSRVQQAQANAGQVSGQERFLRQNRQPGQFVGADARDSQNFFSQLSGGGVSNSGLGAGGSNRSPSGGASRGYSSFGSQFGSQYGSPYGQQYGSSYGSRYGQQYSSRGSTTGRKRVEYRTKLTVGFDTPADPDTRASEALAKRFAHLASQGRLPEISVEMVGETLVLRGQVASSQQRELALQLARLEPFVGLVQSELVVGTDTRASDSSPVPPGPPMPLQD